MDNSNNILSIDFDDDDKNLEPLLKNLEDSTDRSKNTTANLFNEYGDEFIEEINEKLRIKESKKDALIKYVIKHCKMKYTLRQLKSYSYEDVKIIYDEIKTSRKILPKILNFFNF